MERMKFSSFFEAEWFLGERSRLKESEEVAQSTPEKYVMSCCSAKPS
jgi:hypothetical protein